MSSTTLRVQVSWLPTLVIMFGAGVLGLLVAQGHWLYAAAPLVGLLVVLYPVETALGSYSLLIPFDAVSVLSGTGSGTTLTWVVGLGAAVVLIGTAFLQGRLRWPWRMGRWFTMFIVWAVMSSVWALNPAYSTQRILTAVALLGLYLAASSLKITERELARITRCAIAGGLVASIVSIYQFATGVRIESRGSLIFATGDIDPNFFAASLLVPLSLAVAAFVASRGARRLVSMAATLVIAIAVFLTMSRGAVLAAAVIMLVYIIRLRIGWRVVAVVTVLILAALFIPQLFFLRLSESLAGRGTGRLDIWIAGLQSLKHFWLFGAGLDNFPWAYQMYAGYAPFFHGYLRAAHNIYLSNWVETGTVGIILLLAAFRSHIYELHAKDGRTEIVALEAACWGMLTAGLFLDLIWRKSFWFVWILVAIATQHREDTGLRRFHRASGPAPA